MRSPFSAEGSFEHEHSASADRPLTRLPSLARPRVVTVDPYSDDGIAALTAASMPTARAMMLLSIVRLAPKARART
jgi:hypothetical protein